MRAAMLRVAIRILMAFCVLDCCSGCLIPVPLGVLPVSDMGAGKSLKFADEDGQKISTEGFVVVKRNSYGWAGNWSDSRLLAVRDGRVTIPHSLTLGSLWIMPFYGWPMPTAYPEQNLYLFPFIPGFYNDHPIAISAKWPREPTLLHHAESDPMSASIRWMAQSGYVRARRHKQRKPNLDAAILEDAEYARLRVLVNREIERLPNQTTAGGDVNCDCTRNADDIRTFVRFYQGIPAASQEDKWHADFNNDGDVDLLDIPYFVASLLAPPTRWELRRASLPQNPQVAN